MSVYCEGDCRLIEQTGEKQDFEAELTRLGFPHEAFMLYVSREAGPKGRQDWGLLYRVNVRHASSGHAKTYVGTPSRSWVREFSDDTEQGMYGVHGRNLYQTNAGST